MESIILASKAINLVGNIGFSTISHTIDITLGLINKTKQEDNNYLLDVSKLLEDLDIIEYLQVIQSFTIEFDKKEHIDVYVKKCLISVEDIIKIINFELENIQEKIQEHKNKWFSSWRSVNFNSSIVQLENHYKILKSRVNLLIKLTSLSKN